MLASRIQLMTLLLTTVVTGYVIAEERETSLTQNQKVNDVEKTQVTVIIKNVKVDQGPVYVRVFRGEESYKKDVGFISDTLGSKSESVEVCVEVPHGEYSIAVFQDINEDGELNTNLLGIPKEPWGMSNNAPARFGPPKWSDMRFTVTNATVTQQIDLQ